MRLASSLLFAVTIGLEITVAAPQATSARLCVEVTDPAGLPLTYATVTVGSLAGELRREMKTHTDGLGCMESLPEGLYAVEASQVGFMHVRYYPVRVDPHAPVRLSSHCLSAKFQREVF